MSEPSPSNVTVKIGDTTYSLVPAVPLDIKEQIKVPLDIKEQIKVPLDIKEQIKQKYTNVVYLKQIKKMDNINVKIPSGEIGKRDVWYLDDGTIVGVGYRAKFYQVNKNGEISSLYTNEDSLKLDDEYDAYIDMYDTNTYKVSIVNTAGSRKKHRKSVNSKHRKFRNTKKTTYRKSTKNTRKIMKGGGPENVGTYNIEQLDKVGPVDDEKKPYKRIRMQKIFDSEEAAKAFVDEAKKSIGEKNIMNHWVDPFGDKKKDIQTKVPGKFYGFNTITQKVPAQYSVIMLTNYEGIGLAQTLVKENHPDTTVMVM
jgi:hypothetical protein